MFNINIENFHITKDNKFYKLYIKGWAFDEKCSTNIILDNNLSYNVTSQKRIDVCNYYGGNVFALNSGFLIEVENVKEDLLKINFVNSSNQSIHTEQINIKSLYKQQLKTKINLSSLKQVYKSLKNNGINTTFKLIKQSLKNDTNVNFNTLQVLEPYHFIEERQEDFNQKIDLTLAINYTNEYDFEKLFNKLVKLKKQFSQIILVIHQKKMSEDEKLKVAEFTQIVVEENIYSNKELIQIISKNKKLLKNENIVTFNCFDELTNNAAFELKKILSKNLDIKLITANEDRIIKNTYCSPLYKFDLMNEDFNLYDVTRRFMCINQNYLDDYIKNSIKIEEIFLIDKVLYHYTVLESTNHNNKVKPIAFYLPQFHPIPENDEWWGKGFTEWTNVKRGEPQFKDHYQPHIPGKLGYYDLVEDKSIQYQQIELAKKFGIYGFCYYYYWFNGKRLLEKPLDEVLNNKELDFPFCICWANETWSRRWDGQEKEILIKQEHNKNTDEKFIEDIIPILKDERYIKVGNAPLLLIYRAELFPDLSNTIKYWKEKCREAGIEDIHVSLVQSFGLTDPHKYGGDSAVEFPPHGVVTAEISKSLDKLNPNFTGNIYDYRDVVARCTNKRPEGYNLFRGSMLSWDNTARRRESSNIFHYANPEEYRKWLTGIIEYTKYYNHPNHQYIFINAWNEWAEGTHLEPDEKFGTQYLEETKAALESNY